MATTLVLVRHGETDWNRERRYQGHADTPLNDLGRKQARELAEALVTEGASALYSSPLRRARESADIIGRRLELDVVELAALREIDVGDWQGLTIHEVQERYPERLDVDWHAGWPNGETYGELASRVVPALVDLARTHDGGSVLGVTHAGPIRSALMAATGLSYAESRAAVGPLENCSVFRFALRGERIERVD